jgi:hypothetical protein
VRTLVWVSGPSLHMRWMGTGRVKRNPAKVAKWPMSDGGDVSGTNCAFAHSEEMGIGMVVGESGMVDLRIGKPTVNASRLSDAIQHPLQELELLITDFSFVL